MKATIEFSAITRKYYVRLETEKKHVRAGLTRKDDAEREAKRLGATEIEHVNRSTTADLRKIGFGDSAARIAKEFYR
jgi:hypothetical protein